MVDAADDQSVCPQPTVRLHGDPASSVPAGAVDLPRADPRLPGRGGDFRTSCRSRRPFRRADCRGDSRRVGVRPAAAECRRIGGPGRRCTNRAAARCHQRSPRTGRLAGSLTRRRELLGKRPPGSGATGRALGSRLRLLGSGPSAAKSGPKIAASRTGAAGSCSRAGRDGRCRARCLSRRAPGHTHDRLGDRRFE